MFRNLSLLSSRFRCLNTRPLNSSRVSTTSCLRAFSTSDSKPEELSLDSSELEEEYAFGVYPIILPAEPYVWGTSHIKPRTVPPHIQRPHYARDPPGLKQPLKKIDLKDEDKLRRLRNVGRLAGEVREFAGSLVKPGITTDEIDRAVHEMIISRNAYPSPLLYEGFPRSVCTSVNNVVTHGIPDDRPLEEGDIINIDVTVYLEGFHGDTSQNFAVGEIDAQASDLLRATTQSLRAGIASCAPNIPFRNIGRAITTYLQAHISKTQLPLCVSQQFTGHGIGEDVFHAEPWIWHVINDEPEIMQPGDCFTIEPSIIQGTNPNAWVFPDGWTASTVNTARAAQAEHQVLITETGVEVLTL